MRIVLALLLSAAALVLAGCGESAEAQDARVDAAADNAQASDVDASEVEADGYSGCTDDCSGHEAGFEWARDNDLADESECSGDSNSFVEGCEQFVQARQERAEEQAADEVQDDGGDGE